MPRLIFDLDGTLLDVRERHYAVYSDCLSEFGVAPLTFDEYWTRRRSGEGTVQIASDEHPLVIRDLFQNFWLERIESRDWLPVDTLFSGSFALLDVLRGRYELVLATLRRDRAALLDQLGWLGTDIFFDHIISPEGENYPGSKLEMLTPLGRNARTWVIGDSEADVVLTQELGAELICVTNGVRDESFLRAAGATQLIPCVCALPALLPSAD